MVKPLIAVVAVLTIVVVAELVRIFKLRSKVSELQVEEDAKPQE